ncbi:MAG: RluA family pseudouridine synthase [Flavobacteriales bacterium]|nr:RluA family pseudouridine synthase [Flavobacteriales bacterium]
MITEEKVLYEDNHIIVINKAPKEIVQGDITGDVPLLEHVKEFLKEKYNKPGNVFVGLPHRLDRPTSGLVLFAKTSKALSRLNLMFRNKDMKKTYWAVVKEQPPSKKGTLKDYLLKHNEKNKSFVKKVEAEGAKYSELDYEIIAASDRYFLLKINPKTGRHHQIRAQLANMGCPIKGDLKYGFDRSNPDGSIHLHARRLEFIHPVSQEKMDIEALTPDEPLWNAFMKLVKH